MNCKKCNAIIDKEANFCPYCGEPINNENHSYEYDDPFKNIRLDSTHQEQYQYQEKYSNTNPQNQIKYKDDYETVNPIVKNNKSLIGLILGIISIPLCVINKYIGLPVAIIAFILTIIGLKHTSRGLGVTAMIVSIFTLIISLIMTVFLWVATITISFTNGYETTIKDYLTDAFFCGFYENRLAGYWIDSSDELLYLDEEGNYYIYLNYNELTDNYYYGIYNVEDGLSFSNDDILYADDDYYYYQINTFANKAKMEGKLYNDTIDLIASGFTLKLNKENRDLLILINETTDTEIEFERR